MLTHFSITQPGERHILKNKPGDDYSASERICVDGKDYIVAAVADGVGSAVFSRFGSKMAIETAIAFIKEHLAENSSSANAICEKVLFPAFKEALAALITYADATEVTVPSLDTTLTVCVYDGDTIALGHCGDDGVVAMYKNGKYQMITSRMKGNEINSVMPLRFTDSWEFLTTSSVTSFTMMTDGMLDKVVAIEEPLHNRVFYPLIQDLLSKPISDDEVAARARNAWDEFLGGKGEWNIRKYVTDDISLVAVQNSEAVSALPEIPEFDQDAWNTETELFQEWQKEMLSLGFGEKMTKFEEWKKAKFSAEDTKENESEDQKQEQGSNESSPSDEAKDGKEESSESSPSDEAKDSKEESSESSPSDEAKDGKEESCESSPSDEAKDGKEESSESSPSDEAKDGKEENIKPESDTCESETEADLENDSAAGSEDATARQTSADDNAENGIQASDAETQVDKSPFDFLLSLFRH